jgi:SAM-dependent methyltransferase
VVAVEQPSSASTVNADPARLPSAGLLRRQAEWLAPARSRLLRRAAIAQRRRVLDLGAGYGSVTGELSRRSSGLTVALDRRFDSLREGESAFALAGRVCADAFRLPFAPATFDLVFSQCTLMWLAPLEKAIAEVERVLRPAGLIVALEPDYGGLIEHPPSVAVAPLWLAGLRRAGGEPLAGRRLPGLLRERHFAVRIGLLDELPPPSPARFDFLKGLPLDPAEREALAGAEHAAGTLAYSVVHLPFFLIIAEKALDPAGTLC